MAFELAPRPEQHISFINPYATDKDRAVESQAAINGFFLPSVRIDDIYDLPEPKHLQEITGPTLVSSDGGDGTIRRAIGSIIGIQPNDPDATENNLSQHREIAESVVYFARAGGNGNNWSLSAHGLYAREPARLAEATSIAEIEHRPLYWQVLDEEGDIILSDIATSGLGFAGSAKASENLENAKPVLNTYKHKTTRLVHEGVITGKAGAQAAAFSAEVTWASPEHAETEKLEKVAGFELIGSEIYAKQGRTSVNIDDTLWQPMIVRAGMNQYTQFGHLMLGVARLKTGKHKLPPLDLADKSMTMRLTGKDPKPVQFHADGETGESYYLYPGQTFHARLPQLTVHSLKIR